MEKIKALTFGSNLVSPLIYDLDVYTQLYQNNMTYAEFLGKTGGKILLQLFFRIHG